MQNIKLRAGMNLLNKKTNTFCEIAEVKAEGNATAKEFKVDPISMEKVYTGKEFNIVPGMNDIVFRFIDDPEPYGTPEGYTVVDGILMKDGKPVTDQGSLVIKKVVGYTPANVIIEMAPRSGKEGMCDLFTYNPDLDHFEKILKGDEIPDVTVIGHAGDDLLLAYSKTHTEDIKSGDEVAKVEFFDGAAIIIVATTDNPRARKIAKAHAEMIPFPVIVDDVKIVPIEENKMAIMFAADRDVTAVDDVYDEDEYDEEEEVPFAEDEAGNVVTMLEKPILRQTHLVCNGRVIPCFMDYPDVNGKFTYAPAPTLRRFVYNDGKMLIAGVDTLKTVLAAEVADMTLVDITDNGEAIIWSFADDEMNVKKLVATRTTDRGLVVKLQ